MAYTRVNWEDLPSTNTPINATNLNKMDLGIFNLDINKADITYVDDYTDGTKPMGSIVVDDVNCKNLFSGVMYNGIINQSGVYVTNNARITNTTSNGFFLPTGTYTLSIADLDACTIVIKNASGTVIQDLADSWKTLPFTFTTTQDGYICFSAKKNNDATLNPNDYAPQLEIGSTTTNYTKGKHIIKEQNGYVKESTTFYADDFKCKNMFGNYVVINGWIDGTTMRVNSVNGNRMAFIPCQPNTTYTISRSVITSSFRVSDYTTIPSMTSSNVDYTIPTATKNDSGTTITYTTSSTAKYIIIHYANIGSDSSSTIESSLASIQLEIGTEATTYTPYVEVAPSVETIDISSYKTSSVSTITRASMKRYGKLVKINIAISNTSTTSGTILFAGLPYKPSETTELNSVNNNNQATRCTIDSNGNIGITTAQATAYYINGTFLLD